MTKTPPPFPVRQAGMAAWKPVQLPKRFLRQQTEGPHVLSAAPACAARIGQVITAWSSIEHTLVEIMAYTIDAEAWVAAELFQEIRKHTVKTALLHKMLDRKLPDKTAAKKISDAVFKPLTKIADERDTMAHSHFVWSGDYPDAIFLREGWGGDEKTYAYDLATLDALVTEVCRIGDLVMDLKMAVIQLAPRRDGEGRWTILSPPVFLAQSDPQPPRREDKDEEGR